MVRVKSPHTMTGNPWKVLLLASVSTVALSAGIASMPQKTHAQSTCTNFNPASGEMVTCTFGNDTNGNPVPITTPIIAPSSTNVTVTASGNTGSKKLVDDLISDGTKVEEFLQYFKLVLDVCRHACIAVNLKKCSFFPKKATFVGLTRLGTNQRRTSSLQSSNSR